MRSVAVPSARPGKQRARFAPSDGVVRVRGREGRWVGDRDHEQAAGDEPGGRVAHHGPGGRDPFELVAVDRAEDGHRRSIDARLHRHQLDVHVGPGGEAMAGDGRRRAHRAPPTGPISSTVARTAATWARSSGSGRPNGGDVVAWAMMPRCTSASLSAPIATPEKLLAERGAS